MLAGASLVAGSAIGIGLNFLLYIFHSLILGWGDSAPDWYRSIQHQIMLSIMVLSVIGFFIFGHMWYRTRVNKNKGMA